MLHYYTCQMQRLIKHTNVSNRTPVITDCLSSRLTALHTWSRISDDVLYVRVQYIASSGNERSRRSGTCGTCGDVSWCKYVIDYIGQVSCSVCHQWNTPTW